MINKNSIPNDLLFLFREPKFKIYLFTANIQFSLNFLFEKEYCGCWLSCSLSSNTWRPLLTCQRIFISFPSALFLAFLWSTSQYSAVDLIKFDTKKRYISMILYTISNKVETIVWVLNLSWCTINWEDKFNHTKG